MLYCLRRLVVCAAIAASASTTAFAQTPAPARTSPGWRVNVYPVFAWLPVNIGIDVNVPPSDSAGGGDNQHGTIVDSRFDGAVLAGFSAAHGAWRIDADGMWAAVGGDRPDLPNLTVDLDIYYGHGSIGYTISKDLYVTGGVRRLALKYDISIANRAPFSSKPGIWDPVIGVAWHRVARKYEVHGVFEGGGFGVGSDWEYAGALRADWKPVRHFGLTAGYGFLAFKVSQDVANRTFTSKQTLSGPLVGIGLYF